MRSLCFLLLLGGTLAVWAQNSSSPPPQNSQTPDAPSSSESKPAPARKPNLTPPRSDSRINADAIPDEPGGSSSKDTQVDLSPPENDDRAHPGSFDATNGGSGEVGEFHPWDPHKAAKDIEVGDFYFKRKNYAAAESRYREALYYKDNDALATFHLAICLEKMGQPEEARQVYETYLKILPHGPQAEDAKKAIDRLKSPSPQAVTK